MHYLLEMLDEYLCRLTTMKETKARSTTHPSNAFVGCGFVGLYRSWAGSNAGQRVIKEASRLACMQLSKRASSFFPKSNMKREGHNLVHRLYQHSSNWHLMWEVWKERPCRDYSSSCCKTTQSK